MKKNLEGSLVSSRTSGTLVQTDPRVCPFCPDVVVFEPDPHLVVFQNTSTDLVTRKSQTALATLVSKNMDDFGTLTTHRDLLTGTRWGLKDSVDFDGVSRRDTSGAQLPCGEFTIHMYV